MNDREFRVFYAISMTLMIGGAVWFGGFGLAALVGGTVLWVETLANEARQARR